VRARPGEARVSYARPRPGASLFRFLVGPELRYLAALMLEFALSNLERSILDFQNGRD
jgi:hypothetical protein